MTEDKFEEAVNHAGDMIEKGVEKAANKFDKSMNKAWHHASVRFFARALGFLVGVAFIVFSTLFFLDGQQSAANICLVSGIITLLANFMELIIFKR